MNIPGLQRRHLDHLRPRRARYNSKSAGAARRGAGWQCLAGALTLHRAVLALAVLRASAQ